MHDSSLVLPSTTLFSPNFEPPLISWLPAGMPFSLAHLPKPLLLTFLAFAPAWFSGVSALQGDSWCGTLMCVSATVNGSTVTCTRWMPPLVRSSNACAQHRRVEVAQPTWMDGDVSRSALSTRTPSLTLVPTVVSGFGSQMANTPMVILWQATNGTTILSQRQPSGRVEPQPVTHPPRQASVVNSADVVRLDTPRTSCTF